MNPQQKKFIWIAGIAVAAVYFGPSFINSYRREAFIREQNAARLAKVQALASLRQSMGFESVPENYDVDGELTHATVHVNLDDLKMMALRSRPDYRVAQLGVASAQSQNKLA